MRKKILAAIFFIMIVIGWGVLKSWPQQDYPQSPNWRNGRFQNLTAFHLPGLLDYFKWQWSRKPQPWPSEIQNTLNPQVIEGWLSSQIAVTFIGQATFLIQTPEANILTDPVFSDSVGSIGFGIQKRVRAPGVSLDKLPRIDIVFISHNHVDHMDAPSLVSLAELFNPAFIVPLGNAVYLKDLGLQNVIELDWWESVAVKGVDVIITPARHWSQRGIFDQFKALWGGALFMTMGKPIFFAGDTGYDSHFKMIREKYGRMFLSLLPIGSYKPRYFMKDSHMDPQDAVEAHLDLESQMSIGMHFGTFADTDEGYDEPRIDLKSATEKKRVLNFKILDFGETAIIEPYQN